VPIVADASVAIRGDLSGFNADLNRAETTTKGFAGKIKNILSPRNVIGAAGIFGVGLGANALVQYAGDAAESFGELEQTVNTIDEVFGESAGKIHEWGETAAETAGMSQQTFMSSAAIMGQTLQNMGFTIEDSADRTVELLGRAADMALAFGKRPQDALLAITAAMRGERDTIEKFGVAIKQVDVNAKIAALGLDTSTAAAKKNAEAMAVVELVLEQSEDQAGRFAESQDDIAARMATANARFDDFIAKDVGAAIASIQQGAFIAADAIGKWFGEASDDIDAFALNFGTQRAQIMETAEGIGLDFVTLKDRVDAFMRQGYSFEIALDLAANTSSVAPAITTLTDAARDEFLDQVEDDRMGARGAGDMTAETYAAGLKDGEDVVILSAEEIAQIPLDEVEERLAAIKLLGGDTMLEYASGLLSKQTDVQTAIDTALGIIETSMGVVEEMAYLSGQLTMLEHARGVASDEADIAGVNAADAAMAIIRERMDQLRIDALGYGEGVMVTFAAGIVNKLGVVRDASRQLAQGVTSQARIESEPPDHTSPLYGITKWGGNIVQTIADGIYGNLGAATGAAGALAGSLVPSLGGAGVMGMAGVSAMPMGGNTYVLHVNGVQYEVAGFDEMAEKLMELGVLNGDGRLA
jgi:hypothetical protein